MGCGKSSDKGNPSSDGKQQKRPSSINKSWNGFLAGNPTEIDLSEDGRDKNHWMGIDPKAKLSMANIPEGVWQCKSCTKLVISGHEMTELPPQMFEHMTNLVNLEFSDGLLEGLPATVATFAKLQTLEVYRNKIVTVAPEIGTLADLQVLNLYDNAIKSVPKELNNLTSLTELNLGSNKFLVLPSLENLTNLEDLKIHWGKVCRIEGNLEGLTKLKDFMANRNRLSEVPKFPSSIQTIDLNVNFLADLPSFDHCKNIREFSVNKNGSMKELPAGIFTDNLEILKAEETAIESLPDEIGNCTGVKGIFMNKCKLSSLPEGITKCTILQKCDFRNNDALLLKKSDDDKHIYHALKKAVQKLENGSFYE